MSLRRVFGEAGLDKPLDKTIVPSQRSAPDSREPNVYDIAETVDRECRACQGTNASQPRDG